MPGLYLYRLLIFVASNHAVLWRFCHSVSDFGLVIWVDFFQVISDLGRHRVMGGRQFYTYLGLSRYDSVIAGVCLSSKEVRLV